MEVLKPTIKFRNNSYRVSFSYRGKRYRKTIRDKSRADDWIQACFEAAIAGRDIPELDQPPVTDWPGVLAEAAEYVWPRSDKSVVKAMVKILSEYFPKDFLTRDSHTQHKLMLKFSNHTDERYATSYRGKIFALLRAVMRYCESAGYVKELPDFPKVPMSAKDRSLCLSQETEKAIEDECLNQGHLMLRYFVKLMLDTGLRVKEAYDLTVQDYSPATRTLQVRSTKTGTRTIPLTSTARDCLTYFKHLTDGKPTTKLLSHYPRRTMVNEWSHVRKALGQEDNKDFVPYILRHTFITRMVQGGMPLFQVQQLVGHAHITTTARYAHVTPPKMADVELALRTHLAVETHTNHEHETRT